MQANFLCDFHPSSFFKSMNVDERQSLFTEKSESFKNEIDVNILRFKIFVGAVFLSSKSVKLTKVLGSRLAPVDQKSVKKCLECSKDPFSLK